MATAVAVSRVYNELAVGRHRRLVNLEKALTVIGHGAHCMHGCISHAVVTECARIRRTAMIVVDEPYLGPIRIRRDHVGEIVRERSVRQQNHVRNAVHDFDAVKRGKTVCIAHRIAEIEDLVCRRGRWLRQNRNRETQYEG